MPFDPLCFDAARSTGSYAIFEGRTLAWCIMAASDDVTQLQGIPGMTNRQVHRLEDALFYAAQMPSGVSMGADGYC